MNVVAFKCCVCVESYQGMVQWYVRISPFVNKP
jgi:hypothetical protein